MIFNPLPDKQQNVTLTITGSGNVDNCYLTISGKKYYSAATIDVPVGTVVTCYGKTSSFTQVNLNGTQVSYSQGTTTTYKYSAKKNAKIDLNYGGMLVPGTTPPQILTHCTITITDT